MGKPNFNFQKRQKEIAKQKKNEEKRQRKLDKKTKQSDVTDVVVEGGNVKMEDNG